MKEFLEMSKNTEQHALYTDDWTQPIMLKPISVINSQQDNEAYALSETRRKWRILHEHYGVKIEDTQAYKNLITCLLDKHKEAFKVIYPKRQPEKRVGRPSLWLGTGGIVLYADVFREKKKGKNNSQSCDVLSSRSQYKDYHSRLLYNRYCGFKREWGQPYCAALDELLEVLPESFGNNFLGSYLPDSSPLLGSIGMVKIWTKLFSELKK